MPTRILFAAIILVLTSGVYCEEMPVRVKADNLKFDQEAGVITGSGSVEILFEGMTIYSDTAMIDTGSNVATAEGHVRVKHADYQLTSTSITYDISNESAVVFKVKTVFYPTDVKANLYMSAWKITDLPDVKKGEYGTLTTCDYEEPHYHVESRWFDYYPDDKVVGYLVTLYGGPMPVMWTPFYVYNLKKKRAPFSFVYGENEVEGRFLKTTFDYFINNDHNGLFLFDTTEIKGPGYGIDHDYRLDDRNSGRLYLYKMDEMDTKVSDYVIKWSHDLQADPFTKLTFIHNSAYMYLVPSGRVYNNDSAFNYSRDTGEHKLSYGYNVSNDNYAFRNAEAFSIKNSYKGINTSFRWDQSRNTTAPFWKRAHDVLHHDQSVFTDDAKFSMDADYYSYVTDDGQHADEKLLPKFTFTYRGSFYSLRLYQDMYVDYDGRRYRGDDNVSYVEKLPEATISFNTLDLYYFKFDSSLSYTKKHEAQYFSAFDKMRHITTNIYSAVGRASRRDELGLGTALTTSLQLDQYSYDLGDQRYRYEEGAGLDTGLWGFFKNNMKWGRARVDGNTPFYTETLGSQHNYINDTITLYYQDKVNFDVYAGYNYMNSTYDDIKSKLRITPNEKLIFTASGGWSVENIRYLPLVAAVTLTPFPRFVNTADLQYDMNVGKLMSANSLVDLEWGDTWQERFHFKMSNYYDFFYDRYMLREIAFVKDLHCWEGYLSWNEYMKEFRFGMSLKAFPQYPFSYVENPQGNYFNSFMDNMHFEQESPRRY